MEAAIVSSMYTYTVNRIHWDADSRPAAEPLQAPETADRRLAGERLGTNLPDQGEAHLWAIIIQSAGSSDTAGSVVSGWVLLERLASCNGKPPQYHT